MIKEAFGFNRFKQLLCVLCIWPLSMCDACSVRLFSGETHTGKVTVDSSGICIVPEKGPTTKVDPANVFDANFADKNDADAWNFPPGVILANGSFVAGSVKGLEEPTLKLGTQTQPITVQAASIAWIVLAPTPRTAISKTPIGKTGALMASGDFFEGKFLGYKEGKVAINSVLFGPQKFTVKQITAVALRDLQPALTRYEIGTKYARFLSNDLRLDHDAFMITDSALGAVKVPFNEITQIHAGAGRYQYITDLKLVASASGTGPSIRPVVNEKGEPTTNLSTAVNVAVTYPIPAGLSVFVCTVATNKEAPPNARVVFAVYSDGKPVFKSSPIGSATAPQNIRVNFGVGQRISLRVESAAPGSDAVLGQWTEPMLLRP